MSRLRETLAAIEHGQWMIWAQSVLDSESISEERRERWAGYMVPYSDLSEEAKDHDRKWADIVLAVLREYRNEPTPSGLTQEQIDVGDFA